MKQGSPIHIVAGVFETITPYAQRMGRKTERSRHIRQAPCRSSSALQHACSRKPEGRSDRCPCVHRSDGAEAYYAASWPAVSHLSEAISADDPYACADPQRSPNGVPTAQKSHEKVCGGGNIPLRPGDRGTRSQHVPTSKDCLLFPTNRVRHRSSSSITKEPHLFSPCICKRMCRGRTLTVSRLLGQDKANFRSHLASLASVCLHIGFSTLDRHFSGTLQGA